MKPESQSLGKGSGGRQNLISGILAVTYNPFCGRKFFQDDRACGTAGLRIYSQDKEDLGGLPCAWSCFGNMVYKRKCICKFKTTYKLTFVTWQVSKLEITCVIKPTHWNSTNQNPWLDFIWSQLEKRKITSKQTRIRNVTKTPFLENMLNKLTPIL